MRALDETMKRFLGDSTPTGSTYIVDLDARTFLRCQLERGSDACVSLRQGSRAMSLIALIALMRWQAQRKMNVAVLAGWSHVTANSQVTIPVACAERVHGEKSS